MPELRHRWGYPAVLALMAVVTAADLRLVPPARLAAAMSFWTLLLGALLGAGGGVGLAAPARAPGVAPGVVSPSPARSRRWNGSGERTAPPACGSRRWTPATGSRTRSAWWTPSASRWRRSSRWTGGSSGPGTRSRAGRSGWRAGTLVFHAAAGVAVGLLLPGGADAVRLEAAESDLRRLADGVRRRPQIVQLAQASTQEASLESVGSVGLRLAYQLERMLDAQVVVAAFEAERSGRGWDGDLAGPVRVIGVSGRGDRRLLDSMLPPDSDLARVSRAAIIDSIFFEGDPLGGVVPDRRQRPARCCVLPMRAGERFVGGVALWPPGGREPAGGARTEIMAALANAGPAGGDRARGRQAQGEDPARSAHRPAQPPRSRRRAQPGGRGRGRASSTPTSTASRT